MATNDSEALYGVRALSKARDGWQAVLHVIGGEGRVVRQERRIWHCPGEPRPNLEVGQFYTKHQLAMAVSTRCSHAETMIETVVD